MTDTISHVDETKSSSARKRGRSSGNDIGMDHPQSIVEHLGFSGAHVLAAVEEEVKNCRLLEQQIVDLNSRKTEAAKVVDQQRQLQSADVISLNVGGKLFLVPQKTLLSGDENSYFHSLVALENNSSLSVQKDESSNIFIDRDPDVFGYVLNYLRGYTKFGKIDGNLAKKLRIDAEFFRLPKLLRLLEEDRKERLQFRPGPGVNADGDRLRVAFGVAVVGEHDLVTGRHRIRFGVVADEYVGVGIVSDACTNTDHEFHKTPLCCVYYMSGVFYSNYPHHRKEELSDTVVRFSSGDTIDIEIDMEKDIAEFVVTSTSPPKKVTKLISLGKAKRLRFAVTAKSNSTIRILQQPEESVVNVIG